jgi:hypothetical protein
VKRILSPIDGARNRAPGPVMLLRAEMAPHNAEFIELDKIFAPLALIS